MENNLVNIIIPTYNRAHHITDALNSVRDQTYRPLEVIVVDDGSTDNTAAVVEKWIVTHSTPDFNIQFFQQENKGAPAARNRGLREATGYWMKFLDSDDILASDSIGPQVEMSSNLKSNEIVFGDLGVFYHDSREKKPEYYDSPADQESTFEYLITHIVNTPTPLHRTELLRRVGGFREGIEKGQEYDLHLRLAMHAVRFVYSRGVVAYKRVQEKKESISSSNSVANNPEAHIFIQDNRAALADEHYDGDLPLSVQTTIARGYWIVGRQLVRAGYEKQARYCFEQSRGYALDDTNDHIVGPRLYPWLVCGLGPIRAEQTLSGMKRLLGR